MGGIQLSAFMLLPYYVASGRVIRQIPIMAGHERTNSLSPFLLIFLTASFPNMKRQILPRPFSPLPLSNCIFS